MVCAFPGVPYDEPQRERARASEGRAGMATLDRRRGIWTWQSFAATPSTGSLPDAWSLFRRIRTQYPSHWEDDSDPRRPTWSAKDSIPLRVTDVVYFDHLESGGFTKLDQAFIRTHSNGQHSLLDFYLQTEKEVCMGDQ